ncbi:MAG: hypothetical protein P4L77_09480 [Sulfuriferula sp.]|nr:hypothetical protein [Sulfuriferula sp.]
MTKPTLITPPSLLDAATSPAQTAPGLLSSLDGNASIQTGTKRPRRMFWFIISLLLIGVLAGAAAMMVNSATSTFAPAKSVPQPSAAVANALPATPAEAAPAQVATIINDPPATADKPANAAAFDNNPHDRLSAALASPQDEPAKIAAHIPVATGSAHPSVVKPAASKTKAAKSDIEDRDVKLLTALVASNKDIPVNKKSSHTDSKASAAGKSASTKDDARNQDIVERKPGDSTASLLLRCKKLGLIEGELCRWRICSERWDSDSACKANTQAKAPAVVDTSVQ